MSRKLCLSLRKKAWSCSGLHLTTMPAMGSSPVLAPQLVGPLALRPGPHRLSRHPRHQGSFWHVVVSFSSPAWLAAQHRHPAPRACACNRGCSRHGPRVTATSEATCSGRCRGRNKTNTSQAGTNVSLATHTADTNDCPRPVHNRDPACLSDGASSCAAPRCAVWT